MRSLGYLLSLNNSQSVVPVPPGIIDGEFGR